MLTGTRPDEPLCDEIITALCDYHDAVRHGNELTPAQRRIGEHVNACADCQEAFDMLCDACGAENDRPDKDER